MTSSHRDSQTETEHHIGNLFESAKHAKDKAKVKTKQLLSPAQPRAVADDEEDIFADAAFDSAQALKQASEKRQRSTGEAIRDDLKSAKYLVIHPRRIMRSKATHVASEKLGRQHPLLTLDQDQDLLEAHDAFSQAVSSNASDTSDIENVISELDEAHGRVQKVEEQRESLQTAWILSRHVSRVKVVRPVSRPVKSQFKKGDRFEWERYLGYMALYYTRNFTSGYIDDFSSPPLDLEDLARIIERIAITSAPWQSFLVKVRHVYMWKDPRRTAKWLALYLVLWYTQYIVAYFYFYVIYSTLRNRFRETSIRTVRESVGRAIDRKARVQAWGELIQRHGQHDWLEQFLNEIGPIIQLQLGDLADLLEILVNFHRWERASLTLATLFFFSCCLLISLCADMEFCMKLVWFIAGGAFFLTYPLATNFPKYRLLLSHWRWVFWNIPTHAELAVLTLQEKAASKEASFEEFEYKDDDQRGMRPKELKSTYSFKVYDSVQGKCQLTVGRKCLTISTKDGSERNWPFFSFVEIRKLDPIDVQSTSTLKNLSHLHSRYAEVLQFKFLDDTDLTILLHPADRDRVFNLILAWSGLKWQCLHVERHNTLDSERSNLDRAIKRAFV
ncbi:hypothetical protein A1O7_04593 [Cladophialophora yegresii CBS 114405]|uniref:Uncharacterized protein n=1 Tax=Cladophialophora yegresii CBS 114405 TaxID=1182544 RepID=W9W7D4_9EURO|nr:uncharacterized protein A1O7_04593 [Cladophialophora yegresii CBS 114405]EXJ60441.1 hypothetical protein A1O7_04593 [Cladophialophora yegresii CBS 114405]